MLQRMNDLSVQYNSGVQNTDCRPPCRPSSDSPAGGVTRIADKTEVHGVSLFNDADLDSRWLRQR